MSICQVLGTATTNRLAAAVLACVQKLLSVQEQAPPPTFVIFRVSLWVQPGIRGVRSSTWPDDNHLIFNEMTKSMSEKLLEKQSFEKIFDFKFESSFWEEFSIAENYGSDGIREHYKVVFDQWKGNLKYLTELVLVLNWKISTWFGVDDSIGKTYDELMRDADGYALNTLKGDDLHYYLSTLD